MDRAYVVCHMMLSLDGKITGDFFNVKESGPTGEFYDSMTLEYSKGWCCGRETFEYLSDHSPLDPKYEKMDVPDGDYIILEEKKPYCFAIDRYGKLHWKSPYNGYTSDASRVVEVVTKRASKAFLAYLRDKGISYIFSSDDDFDTLLFLKKIKAIYGLDKLALCGGGHINGAFYEADLIDEISLTVAPVVDGKENGLSFMELKNPIPRAYRLNKVEKLGDGGIYLDYLRK